VDRFRPADGGIVGVWIQVKGHAFMLDSVSLLRNVVTSAASENRGQEEKISQTTDVETDAGTFWA